MGRLFGQRARLLLNFDSVFAAEVLTSIAPREAKVDEWSQPYHALNCFALPADSDLPPVLRFTAAITVVMAEIKVADHILDSRAPLWKAARRVWSRSFRRAERELRALDFPLDDLLGWVDEQNVRERRLLTERQTADPDALLDQAIEATAEATAIAFAHGAGVAGRPDTVATLGRLGRAFGGLVYLLDALDDFEEDRKKGHFNAIAAAYRADEGKLSPSIRRRIERRLRALEAGVAEALGDLPLNSERRRIFVERLSANLRRAIGPKLPVLASAHPKHTCAPVTLGDRWRAATALGRSITKEHLSTCPSPLTGYLRAPFVFALSGGAGFVFPARTASATTLGEVLDAGLNIPAIGSALAALVRAPFVSSMGSDPNQTPSLANWPGSEQAADAIAEGAKKKRGSGDPGDDGSCCDTCCDCCDCGDWCQGDGCHCCCSTDHCSCCSSCEGCGDCGCSNSCCDCDCGGCCDCSCD